MTGPRGGVVTAGAGGVGLAIAPAFAAQGGGIYQTDVRSGQVDHRDSILTPEECPATTG